MLSPFAGSAHLRLLLPASLLLLFAFLSPVFGASGGGAGNIVFILDASGSMKAQVQGKIKMDVAKEALSGLIRELPAGVKVGLVVYGHRQKDDCQDVEELAPLGPVNKDELTQKIKGINARGKTPITYSVRQVAEGLQTIEEEATIVLVSDGEETCNADPCAAVKELKEAGIKFVMHVIGFDVTEKEKAQLSCMAQAGGGSYFSAKNAGEFSSAARKVVEKTEQSAARLKVTALRNGKPVRAYCDVFKSGEAEGEDGEKEKVTEGWLDAKGTVFKLSPGVYDIKVANEEDSNRPVMNFNAVKLETGKSVDRVADFSGGTLRIRAQRNGKPMRAYSTVIKSEGEEEKTTVAEGWIEPEGTAFKLTPGVYEVKVKNEEDANSPAVAFSNVAIEAGKSIEKVADFSGGTLKVKALRNGKPFRAYAVVQKSVSDEEESTDPETIAEGWVETEGTPFKLTPGTYDVKITNEEDSNRPVANFQKITVEAGKSVEKVAEFSGGSLRIKSSRSGKPLRTYCEVYAAAGRGGEEEEQEKEKVAEGWVEGDGVVFRLTPGNYEAVVKIDETEEKKEFKELTIEPGKVRTLEAQF